MKIYNELESLGFFEWLSKTHNLKDTDISLEYLDELPLNDIHRTVVNATAFRWFREKYNLRGFIGFRPNTKQFDCHIYDISLSGLEYAKQRTMEEFNKDPKVGTYEEAELTCLMKLIEIAKNQISMENEFDEKCIPEETLEEAAEVYANKKGDIQLQS